MVYLLLPMALEPPPRFVAFVERHLPALRRDAGRVVGSAGEPDELYPLVLIDVAKNWVVLQVIRERLRGRRPEEDYLGRAFARHADRWRREQVWSVEADVWRSEQAPRLEIEVWFDDPPLAGAPTSPGARDGPTAPTRDASGRTTSAPARVATSARARVATSAATRLAPFVVPSGVRQSGPLAEATIAWLRARAARRQGRMMIWLAIAAIIALALVYLAHRLGSE